jgi:hypothetical protein
VLTLIGDVMCCVVWQDEYYSQLEEDTRGDGGDEWEAGGGGQSKE